MKIKVKKFETEVEVEMPLYNDAGQGICLGDVITEIIEGIVKGNVMHKTRKTETQKPVNEEPTSNNCTCWKLLPSEMPSFKTREEAEHLLTNVEETINKYGQISIWDVKEMVGHGELDGDLDANYKQFGWDSRSNITITQCGNSPMPYRVIFPLALKIQP